MPRPALNRTHIPSQLIADNTLLFDYKPCRGRFHYATIFFSSKIQYVLFHQIELYFPYFPYFCFSMTIVNTTEINDRD